MVEEFLEKLPEIDTRYEVSVVGHIKPISGFCVVTVNRNVFIWFKVWYLMIKANTRDK